MAKQPKLDYDSIEVLYNYGYNTKEIAALMGSVNGHISKVLRLMGVPTRKRGEIAHKTAYYDMDSDAQTMLTVYKETLDEMYQNWAENLKNKQAKKVTTVKREAKTKVVKKIEEHVPGEVTVLGAVEAKSELNEKYNNVTPVAVVEVPAKEDVQVEEPKQTEEAPVEVVEETVPAELVKQPATIELEVEKTVDGYEIIRGEEFRTADLMVQG
ncbi:hypothetical protein, partial [Bacillus mycoides]|uniref:hypothetical protein n=1 Tax=Bacillus mycoides TaxID=1405 RepID=UPI003A8042AD